MLKIRSNTGVCLECSLIITMYLIYLIDSDALWCINALLQALLKTQDLDTRVHLSCRQGESFSEGATVLCWAGLKPHQVTSLKLQWQFLLCILCTWIQTSANWEAKTPTTLRGRPRQSPKAQLQTADQTRSSAKPALLQACKASSSSPGGGEGVWAWPKAGKFWWESAKRRLRASDTDLGDSVGPALETCPLHALNPSTSPRHEQHSRQDSIPPSAPITLPSTHYHPSTLH